MLEKYFYSCASYFLYTDIFFFFMRSHAEVIFIRLSSGASAVFLRGRLWQDAAPDDDDLNRSLYVHYFHSSHGYVLADGHFSNWFGSLRRLKYYRTTETMLRCRQISISARLLLSEWANVTPKVKRELG